MTEQNPARPDPSRPCSVREIVAGPAGPVRIELALAPSGGQLMVSGPDIPLVSVQPVESALGRNRRERAEAATLARGKLTAHEKYRARRFRAWAAQPDLFSRNAVAVSMTVDGARAELRPSRGHLERSSFDVRAQVGERSYLLSQSGRRAGQVLRDGRLVAELRRSSRYQKDHRYEGDLAWEAGVDHLDVAITHTFATAYRVGADGFFLNLLKLSGLLVLTAALGG